MTVLWATHLTDEVRREDDLLLLHRGRLLASGRASALTEGEALQDWFLARTGEPA